MVKINGEYVDVSGKTVLDYLTLAGYDTKRVAAFPGAVLALRWNHAAGVVRASAGAAGPHAVEPVPV